MVIVTISMLKVSLCECSQEACSLKDKQISEVLWNVYHTGKQCTGNFFAHCLHKGMQVTTFFCCCV